MSRARIRFALSAPWLIALAMVSSCGTERGGAPSAGRDPPGHGAAPSSGSEDAAVHFERGSDEAHVRARLAPAAKRRVARSASVELPVVASGATLLEDDTTHVAVRFALRGASDAPLRAEGSVARYPGAYEGNDVTHRVHAEGAEDYVHFETTPSREELAYDVDLVRVAGLRLVGNTLELLDDGGAPRLRVAPPYVIDATGARRDASLAVDGCAYDTSPAGPWGRPLTDAGSRRCVVRVRWEHAMYPAIVDPSWMATGSMTASRGYFAAALLPSGKVLLAGGSTGATDLSSAELFDGVGSFAATGSMATPRVYLTATLLASGKVLVAGGSNGSGELSSAELFDGVGSFAPTGSLAKARHDHTATLLPSGQVLIAGGTSVGYSISDAELFDGTATFTATSPMSTVRSFHAATLLASGKVLVTGGFGQNILSTAELFDGAGGFAPTGTMTTARFNHTATTLASGKALVAGGAAAADLSSAEIFDGASFVATGSMTVARRNHTATLLTSGKILVAGGASGFMGYSSAELFDPMGTFAATGTMTSGRAYHRAVLLDSGKVLLAGGGAVLSSAEIFDLKAAGASCAANDDCVSGVCDDGACCIAACPNRGLCQSCTPGTGACAPVTNRPDPDTCSGTSACDATGSCVANTYCSADANCLAAFFCDANGRCQPQKALAAPCNTAAAADCKTPGCRECASGFCADGVCCDRACNETCVACSAAHKQSRTDDGTCGPSESSTTCVNTATCNGNSARDPTGNETPCAPYICQGGACRKDCAQVGDCAAPNVCDPGNKCVAPTSGTSGGSGGCAVAGVGASAARVGDGGNRGANLTAALLGLAVVLARRARRRV